MAIYTAMLKCACGLTHTTQHTREFRGCVQHKGILVPLFAYSRL